MVLSLHHCPQAVGIKFIAMERRAMHKRDYIEPIEAQEK